MPTINSEQDSIIINYVHSLPFEMKKALIEREFSFLKDITMPMQTYQEHILTAKEVKRREDIALREERNLTKMTYEEININYKYELRMRSLEKLGLDATEENKEIVLLQATLERALENARMEELCRQRIP